MPETISKTDEDSVVGAVFLNRENADEAIQTLKEAGIPANDIQVVVLLDGKEATEACVEATDCADSKEDVGGLFYDKAVTKGKVLVAVHHVTDPAPVIEIFDENQAECNPDGSRNVRQDVVGLTAGAATGAAAGGVVGMAAGGPIGGAIGAAAGALVGGGAGAVVGTVTEHRK